MGGDGDGWVTCSQGHRHWGRWGAAGLLLRHRRPDGTVLVLLQHRALWSHHGGTWGIPGGARDSGESAEQAALRETAEEVGLDPALVRVTGTSLEDHGGWAYATVLAELDAAPEEAVRGPATGETLEARWVAEDDVSGLPLHPGFAGAWPRLAVSPGESA